jgi:hypothetical protein
MTFFDRIISATVSTTGEVIEYHVQSPGELTEAFKDVEAHLEAYRLLKNSMLNTSMNMLNRKDEK